MFTHSGAVVSWIYSIGLVLILIAVRYISEALADESIFNNMLIYFILAILSIIMALTWMSTSFMSGPEKAGAFSAISSVIFAVSAMFLKRSYDMIAVKLNVKTFSTAGLLILIEALLSIAFIFFIFSGRFLGEAVLLLGALLSIIQGIISLAALIFQATAFLSVPDGSSQFSEGMR
ncbi:MAG TPA: DUF996 domain-containing protein [Candidatus Methanoperedens sp.]